MWISVEAMAYSLLITSVLSQIINSSPNKKLLGYNYLNQLKDMLPQIGLSLMMGIIVFGITFLDFSPVITLLIQIPLGMTVYIALSKIFHVDSFIYLLSIISQFVGKKRKT